VPKAVARWTEHGEAPDARLRRVEQTLRGDGALVRRGGDWDQWDLEVTCGTLGAARLIMAVEDHGAGNQLIRVRWWPSVSTAALALTVGTAALSVTAGFDGGWSVAAILGTAAAWVVLRALCQCGAAVAVIERAVHEQE
jgi:hypothetical protein